MKITLRIFFSVMVIFLISACSSPALLAEDVGGGIGGETERELEKKTPVLPLEEADLVLTQEDNFGTYKLKVGQLLAITLNLDVEFRVTYDPQYLTLISPTKNPETGGLEGWFFEAVDIGTTKNELLSIPPSESSGAPSLIYEVTIEISELYLFKINNKEALIKR